MGNHRFKSYEPDQLLLLPPDMRDWLPEGHLAWFVSDLVDQAELSAITDEYLHLRGGNPGFHPALMTKLLVYGYCVGVASSRQIEKKTYEDVGFRVLAAGYHPDHSTIAAFRKRYLEQLTVLFIEVLLMAEEMGMVKLGHVALDGTKVKANASKHKAMSYGRMEGRILELKAEVDELLSKAQKTDRAEDKKYGKGKRGDEVPEEIRFRERRIARIKEAKVALEAAEALKAQKSSERGKDEEPPSQAGRGGVDSVPKPPPEKQYNFTDPESRIMRDGATKSFMQCFNAQIAVDSDSQIIVSADITQEANDKGQLRTIIEQIEENTGQIPDRVLADAGYFSEENVEYVARNWMEPFICRDREKHSAKPESAPRGRIPENLSIVDRMLRKLKTKEGRQTYSRRKESVEAVFGQIKQVRGFRQFLLRGLEHVKGEWNLICLGHNVLKMWRSGISLPIPAR
jgi:transposase